MIWLVLSLIWVPGLETSWLKTASSIKVLQDGVKPFNLTVCETDSTHETWINPMPDCRVSEDKEKTVPLHVTLHKPILSEEVIKARQCKRLEVTSQTFKNFVSSKFLDSQVRKWKRPLASDCISYAARQPDNIEEGVKYYGKVEPKFNWMSHTTTVDVIYQLTEVELAVEPATGFVKISSGLTGACTYAEGQCQKELAYYEWITEKEITAEIECPVKKVTKMTCLGVNRDAYLVITCPDKKLQLHLGDGRSLDNNHYCNHLYRTNDGYVIGFDINEADPAKLYIPDSHHAEDILGNYTLERITCDKEDEEETCVINRYDDGDKDGDYKDIEPGSCHGTWCGLQIEWECRGYNTSERWSRDNLDLSKIDKDQRCVVLRENGEVGTSGISLYKTSTRKSRSYIRKKYFLRKDHSINGYTLTGGKSCTPPFVRGIQGTSYEEVINNVIELADPEITICEQEFPKTGGVAVSRHTIHVEGDGQFVIRYTGRPSTGLTTDLRNAELSFLYSKIKNDKRKHGDLSHQVICHEAQELWILRNELSEVTSRFVQGNSLGSRQDIKVTFPICLEINNFMIIKYSEGVNAVCYENIKVEWMKKGQVQRGYYLERLTRKISKVQGKKVDCGSINYVISMGYGLLLDFSSEESVVMSKDITVPSEQEWQVTTEDLVNVADVIADKSAVERIEALEASVVGGDIDYQNPISWRSNSTGTSWFKLGLGGIGAEITRIVVWAGIAVAVVLFCYCGGLELLKKIGIMMYAKVRGLARGGGLEEGQGGEAARDLLEMRDMADPVSVVDESRRHHSCPVVRVINPSGQQGRLYPEVPEEEDERTVSEGLLPSYEVAREMERNRDMERKEQQKREVHFRSNPSY